MGIVGTAGFHESKFNIIRTHSVKGGGRAFEVRPATPEEDAILRPALLDYAKGLGDDRAEVRQTILDQLTTTQSGGEGA
ncbi:MAG TPA: hypothetical protein VGO93_23945 [Candidatus Xenobia bacterium]